MSLDLVKRAAKGSRLTAADHDANLDALEAAAFPSDVLVVRRVEDLPDPAGDQVTLPAKTVLLAADINIGSDALRLSTGTLLRGLGGERVTSSNTNGVIRASGLNEAVVMREFSVIATAGPCLDLAGPIEHQLNLFFLGLFGAAVGEVSGFDVQALKDCFISAADGVTFTGTTNKLFISQCPFYGITAGNAAITLDAGLDARRVDMVTNFFKHDPDGIPMRAEAGHTVGYGRVYGSMMDGPTTMLDGVTPADTNWWFNGNDEVQNSRVAAQSFLIEPATTPIATQGTYVPVTGPFTLTDLTQRMELNGDNEIVYTGTQPVLATFDAAFSVDPSNNDQIGFKASKNGSVLEYSATVVEQGAGSGAAPRTGAVVALIELEPGDRIGLSVANLSGTGDIPWLRATYAVTA